MGVSGRRYPLLEHRSFNHYLRVTTFIISVAALCFQAYQETSLRIIFTIAWALILFLTLWAALSGAEEESGVHAIKRRLLLAVRTVGRPFVL